MITIAIAMNYWLYFHKNIFVKRSHILSKYVYYLSLFIESSNQDLSLFLPQTMFLISSNIFNIDISVCWEWREGRLLTYEVIIRYLITNNTYYTLSRVNLNNQTSRMHLPLNKSVNEGQLLGFVKSFSFLFNFLNYASCFNLFHKNNALFGFKFVDSAVVLYTRDFC